VIECVSPELLLEKQGRLRMPGRMLIRAALGTLILQCHE
jgi:hypothetical protein